MLETGFNPEWERSREGNSNCSSILAPGESGQRSLLSCSPGWQSEVFDNDLYIYVVTTLKIVMASVICHDCKWREIWKRDRLTIIRSKITDKQFRT